MQLRNTFTIDAPVDDAWGVLNTPEVVAPCFPGATLTDYEGDTFAGTVKIKIGPISMLYKGRGTYVTRNPSTREVVIEASGRDSRGNGSATATVTASLSADGPDRSVVTIVTDMKITGRPAQLGRNVMNDVADRIIGQFAARVADTVGGASRDTATDIGTAGSGTGEPAQPAAPDHSTSRGASPAANPQSAQAIRPQPDVLDLASVLGSGIPALRRSVPVLIAALLLLVGVLRVARRLIR